MKEFFEETLANRLPKYENILKANNEGKGFFVGDKVTVCGWKQIWSLC